MKSLTYEEIKIILRAADAIIASGGRTLLAKILKGSREKKVLELGLDQSPVYGALRSNRLEDIMQKIDWMIDYDFLEIEYNGKLPMIIYTERGWLIERDQYTDEFLDEWKQWLDEEKVDPDMTYLKDRNRGMIFLFLEKIKETGEKRFIPYLKLWKEFEYKKVMAEIQATINALDMNEPIDQQPALKRKEEVNKALEGYAPQDILLKCWECGNRFTFTIGEQQFYKQRGFAYPKQCKKCRDRREDEWEI